MRNKRINIGNLDHFKFPLILLQAKAVSLNIIKGINRVVYDVSINSPSGEGGEGNTAGF